MRCTVALALLAACAPGAHAQRVVADGLFSDWDEAALVATDAVGDSPAGIDLGRLWAARGEGRLFLSFEVGAEINLQGANALTLFVDTDANPATGLPVNAEVGAELEWRFGERTGTAYLEGRPPASVPHTALGFFSSPTVTSTRFEVAFRDDAELAGVPIFSEAAGPLRMVLRDGVQGDALPDAGGVLVHPTPSLLPLPGVTLERESPEHLRLVTYNVLQDGIFDPSRELSFGRLLRAIRPDVIALQEVYTHSAAAVEARLETFLPSAAGERWYTERAATGSDVFLASRFPIIRVEPLCAVATLPSTCNGAFFLDLSSHYQSDLYVVVAHPPCCTTGNNETYRQEEVDLIAAHLRDARADGRLPAGTPFAITGDLNLVGNAQQLRTLVTGDIVDNVRFGPDFAPDWDGSDLGDALPLTTGVPGAFTWYDEGSDFHPGRLDFVLYSDAELTLARRFALFTPALLPSVLTAYGLAASDAVIASDHLPVVADLALPLATSSAGDDAPETALLFNGLSPNPTRGPAVVQLVLRDPADVRLDVLDVLGRVVWTAREHLSAGAHDMALDLAALGAGVYLVRVSAGSGAHLTRRLVVGR